MSRSKLPTTVKHTCGGPSRHSLCHLYIINLSNTEEESVLPQRSIRWSLVLVLVTLVAAPVAIRAFQATGPVQLTAQEDHQRLMDLLHIASLRQGANGSNPQAPNYANYDESKANPYPNLPDPLLLKNGRKVTTAVIWWNQRRPEIVEEFDR